MRAAAFRVFLLASFASIAMAAQPQGPILCTKSSLVEVLSFDKLPDGIKLILAPRRAGLDGIADRGEEFNRGDAIVGSLPLRRFNLAGLGSNCAIVSIQHGGGLEFGFELFAFRRATTGWVLEGKRVGVGEPDSVKSLIEMATFAFSRSQSDL